MANKKSFKQTPIPYRTKSGEPMRYYVLDEECIHETEVTRAECLARPETSDNPYPQRWYVDDESGLVIRLPRNEKGEDFARDNMRYIWREQKYQERKYACVWKGTNNCDQDCDRCSRRVSRTVDLDTNFGREADGDDSGMGFEPASDYDVEGITEEKALLDTLYAALAALTETDRDLMKSVYWENKTERQLAPELGLKEPKSVNKRKKRVLEILRQNESLKSFFE
jgi:hypothetical protein